MVKQVIDIDGYWEVVVYYDLNYHFWNAVETELKRAGVSDDSLKVLLETMSTGEAKAVTYSNSRKRISVVLFNRHDDIEDYINSLVHEAEHVKQAMLKEYEVEDSGEDPAYTVGYIVGRMWEVFSTVQTI